MPRQNFISKDFFVNASENLTKETILTIPKFIKNIKFVGENTIIHSIKFLYERPGADIHHYVDVSVLPLNDHFTRVTLHGSYANGQSFYSDNFISNALSNFESAINAGLNGTLPSYEPQEPKVSAGKRLGTVLAASLGMVFLLWKRVS